MMRLLLHSSALLASLILLLPTIGSATDVCEFRLGEKTFNLHPLEKPHSVVWVEELNPPTIKTKTTFTIDLCRPLRKLKGVPAEEQCPSGTYICAIERLYNEVEKVNGTIEGVIGVAGEYGHNTGEHLDPKWTRLSTSVSPNERKNGFRLEINGVKYKDRKQKAVIDFICPQEKKEERRDRLSDPVALAADGKEEGDGDEDEEDPNADAEVDDGQGGRLKFLKYEDVEKGKILSLEWTTKYACEDAKADPVTKTGHWGFFTWLIIILFLGAAAYLIFGSWLNYNRYSARGWDLLPHSEAIRDIPYLLRDWMRRVVNTIQGGGSRGGYSAV